MKEFENVFKALSDGSRLRIMLVLRKAKKELCICEIMDALGMAQYHVSRHVKELRIAGLVRERKEGRFVYYSIAVPDDCFHRRVMDALGALDAVVAGEDTKRLKKRLALRKAGRCVVGIKKCC